MFWLSHHHPDEFNRTYRLGGLRVCARCLGTYPVLMATLVGLFIARAPLGWPWDVPAVLLLTLPALVDWAVGRFRPASGSNAVRTATGVLLGMALGRSLYVHVQRPLPGVLLAQAALVTAVALPVILATYRKPRPD
ncbi:DUF2085 domain-containing protein [Myxococcus llanfairpwllgwyngyllgogerychwyrndrobwllllantysiliogogogochensis]|uniref:DUF2085 domain-containing protein n=1 Tax=Myxococcus llanfairpwllgwyngyllgogerychwyrndrobwllllantysiliogogogochensis TaxID=2590453 RepID=A0A540WQ02_9BACT|nr:DUF2085 domain-containing protein [Myxococcus llanfairpwllgwyngyllgogerychwyrndrobwllllantysiliogogogochensis]TQF11076.1 DUF2085 domain-containing protein [Myxococcus llanfairpwllgwyngyllgogerychwyrndrobwllllantysiliogogogochensis]